MISVIRILIGIFRAKLSGSIYKINFAITSKCNSRCRTCQVWKNSNNGNGDDLTIDEIGSFFRSLPETIVWLSLSGGEPFLRHDLEDICRLAIKNLPNLQIISVPSNGMRTEDILGKLTRILELPIPYFYLNFSLDGPPEIHDTIRGIKGAYHKTWTTYQKVKEIARNNPRLKVNIETTISKFNIDYLDAFFRLMISQGDRITTTIAHVGYLYKNGTGKSDFCLDKNDSEKISGLIGHLWVLSHKSSVFDMIQNVYLKKISQFFDAPQSQPLPCVALKHTIALDAKGNVLPCFMWGKVCGNIRDFNCDWQVFQSKQKQVLKNIRQMIVAEQCPNCWTPCEAYQSIIDAVFKLRFKKMATPF